MQNYRMQISYDGSRYFGWERQPDKELTIQGKLEAVLGELAGQAVQVIGAGRTDAGVHALAMTANAHLDSALPPEEIRQYLNRYLPEDIRVNALEPCAERFHARYNASGKLYRYSCYIGEKKPVFERKYLSLLSEKPDVENMRAAAEHFLGEHDFRSFCGNPRMKKSTVRRIDRIEIVEREAYLRLYFHGSGFLQYQVRIMTGTLLEVGYGKRSPESMASLLSAKERAQAGFLAEAKGLCLVRVDYN